MPEGNVLVSVDTRGVATITLNRPEVHNAFDDETIERLTREFRTLGDDEDVRVVLLTARGKTFCAGQDLREYFRGLDDNPAERRRVGEASERWRNRRLVDYKRGDYTGDDLGGPSDPINFVHSSIALVGDNSFFGFTSPVRGSRYRLELETTAGNLNYSSILLDYRRYFNPVRELTFAFRGLHYGRYRAGMEDTNSFLQPFYIGRGSLVRGYSYNSFDPRECSSQTCPERERLYGQRIGVASAEVRVPLLGVERMGLINLDFLPTELVLFTDAGIAWNADNPPVWEFERSSAERIPVFSSGASARLNVLGFIVVEVYYAIPWQRPSKGGHFGFQLQPGW